MQPVISKINLALFPPGMIRRLLAVVLRWDLPSEFDRETQTIIRAMPFGGTIVDVGSSVGVFTEVFLARGYSALSVEPRAKAVESQRFKFSKYIAARRLKVYQLACSDRAGMSRLNMGRDPEFSSLEMEWTSHVFPDAHTGKAIEVATKPLAAVLADAMPVLRDPVALKIDVEGHEEAVLNGLFMEDICQIKPIAVMFEIHTSPSQMKKVQRCVSLLKAHGYRRFKYFIRYSKRLLHHSGWMSELTDLSAWDGKIDAVPAGHRYGNVIAMTK